MNWRKKWKTGASALLAVVMLGTLLSACSGGNGEEQPAAQTTESSAQPSVQPSEQPAQQTEQPAAVKENEEPFPIEIMSMLGSAEAPKDNSEVKKELERLTNTKLDITWVPQTAYNDKLNATLASGTLPQVMYTSQTKSANIINAARAGAFWEIGPYLKEFPNLDKLDKEVLNGAAIDGKIYQLVRYRSAARHVVTYRKDWLDKLGLQPPKTLDDFYNIAKAFTQDDPDGNGKDDTVGFVDDSLNALYRSLAVYNGAPMSWGLQDGQVVPAFMTPEYMEGLKFERKLYAEKLMNSDFSIINTDQRRAMMSQGKAGLMINVETDADLIQQAALQVNPNAVFDIVQGLTGPSGELRASATAGFLGSFLFSKSSIKTEADLRKILGFYDQITTQEMQALLGKGIENVDWKMVDGFATAIPERADAHKPDTNFGQIAVMNPNFGLPSKKRPLQEKGAQLVAENEKIAVYDITRPLMSETYVQKWPELDKIDQDAQIKFIMGEIDEAGYQKAMDQFLAEGGSQIIKEYTEEYNKLGNK